MARVTRCGLPSCGGRCRELKAPKGEKRRWRCQQCGLVFRANLPGKRAGEKTRMLRAKGRKRMAQEEVADVGCDAVG